jgi:predicted DNA-binding protein (MmcQ/YjbR family)
MASLKNTVSMDIETFREYCLSKKGVTEELPFGPETLVFKVMGKVFALAAMDASPFQANLKMDETIVPDYREKYEDVQPGYHMNKKHWNTVLMDSGTTPSRELRWMIDHSYEQVVKGLTKKLKKELETL